MPEKLRKEIDKIFDNAYSKDLSICKHTIFRRQKALNELQALFTTGLEKKSSVAISEAYFRGRNDGLVILEANVAQAKKEQAEEIRRELEANCSYTKEAGHPIINIDSAWYQAFWKERIKC